LSAGGADILFELIVKKSFGADNSWDECIENKETLERYGEFCLSNTPDAKTGNETPLTAGFKSLTHKLEDIVCLLDSSNFRPNGKKAFFTAIGRSEWEDMRWESAAADKRQIINNADFVFTGCETQEMYERGRASLIENEVNNKLLHFSDAHFYSDDTANNTMKIGQSMTWIKCKPTFEGLTQLKFVFDERVKISEKSFAAKKPYNVISKVQFNDNTGKGLFQENPIHLNEDLNAIIGGKSTGKSLLLHHIAKSIDESEVLARDSVVKVYNHENNQDFDFTVIWKDGKKDTLKDTIKTGRKIVYISQSYIDELTSDQFENRIKFNDFVLNILLQDPTAKERFDSFEETRKGNLRIINGSLHRLFTLREEKLKKEEELAEIGDLEGVTSYIDQINSDINILKSDGLSPEESKAYEDYMKRQRNAKIKIDDLTKDLQRVSDFYNLAESNLNEILNEHDSTVNLISTAKVKESILGQAAIYATWKKDLNTFKASIIEEIRDLLKKSNEDLSDLKKLIDPLSEKTSKVAELKKKMLELSEEQNKLIKINAETAIIKDLVSKIRSQTELVLTNYEELENAYQQLANDLKQFSGVSQELDISIQVRFNTDQFNNEIKNNRANKPSLRRVYPNMTNSDDAFEYVFDKNRHKQNIRTFLESILSERIKLNQHGNPRQLAKAIFEDYFYLNFSIKYQNDVLEDMSPGKKNLVVLKLLIELNNSEYPILIDQPEDDLDNRSIYEDLVKFLKFKKHQRQIILVTHNPNVVVGTDCENTIVANQEGQISGRENRKYKFEYVNGAIEDSFSEEGEVGVLFQKGIKEHICDILEGGEKAFQERESRYNFIKS
jgi:predicted ATPase